MHLGKWFLPTAFSNILCTQLKSSDAFFDPSTRSISKTSPDIYIGIIQFVKDNEEMASISQQSSGLKYMIRSS